MPKYIKIYVHYIDAINRLVGKVALSLVFVMMGILLYSAIARSVFNSPVIWAVEMAQFTMAAYYLLGGGFSLLLHAHVRMDVLYCRWTRRKQSKVDVWTSVFLIFYLVLLLYGGVSSTLYSIEYNQTNYSSWAPPMAPIKCIMVLGIFLMLLQAFSELFKDIARAKGELVP